MSRKVHQDFKNLTYIETIWYFMYGLAGPFLTIYFKEFGGIDEVGISLFAYYIILGISSLISIKYLKKNNIRKVFLLGQIFEGLRIIGFIFAQNIYWVYAIQLIGGLTKSLILPSYNHIYVKAGKDEPVKAFGAMTGYTNIALGASALIAGFLINYFGYTIVLTLWGLNEIIYGFYVYFKV